MFKLTLLAAAATTLAGCALLEPESSAIAAAGDFTERAPSAAPLQSVGLNSSPRLRGSQPVGLAPCETGVFRAGECWRKGDRHYVFEDPVPDGLEPSALSAPAPSLVRN